MRTAFFAYGPLFKKGHINEAILITDVYTVLRQILCLAPFPTSHRDWSRIHNMLDLTSLSNTCTYLYSSSLNMIKSVTTKPNRNDLKLVHINITENYRILYNNLIQMIITID